MNDRNSFMDNRTVIAVVVTMGILFGWQYYLKQKYPQTTVQNPAVSAPATNTAVSETTNAAISSGEKKQVDSPAIAAPTVVPEKTLFYEDSNWSFLISSKGMGLSGLKLKTYKDRDKNPVMLIHEGKSSFGTFVKGSEKPVEFNVEKTSENTFVGKANVDGTEIVKSYKVEPATYTIETTLEMIPGDKVPSALETRFISDIVKHESGGMFAPPTEIQSIFSHNGSKAERKDVAADKPEGSSYKNVAAAAIGSLYFASGVVDSSKIIPNFEVKPDDGNKVLAGTLEYPILSKEKTSLSYKIFAGPKATSILSKVDPKMTELVDFGWFSVLGYPILALLKWIYSIIGNYGVAIIFLTLIVRMLVLPFNVMSYKSMKAMQQIQPQMQAVREKYKEDPQRMNLEVMNLMRTHKVNPLGGCLPVLLQLPVFFALYRVLGASIELYQAPFGLWIHDLSLKDPFYILPVLMGITMYIQQKITPTTMDPAQAKVMQFMPILFAFMMISLPSGLTLYIFISTLFGIIQQKIFMRDRTPHTKTIQVTT